MLTERRRTILHFISEYGKANGFPPTVREIGAAVDIHSTASVLFQLDALEKGGWIRRCKSRPRSITIVKKEDV